MPNAVLVLDIQNLFAGGRGPIVEFLQSGFTIDPYNFKIIEETS